MLWFYFELSGFEVLCTDILIMLACHAQNGSSQPRSINKLSSSARGLFFFYLFIFVGKAEAVCC